MAIAIKKIFSADAQKRKQMIFVSLILLAFGLMSFSLVEGTRAGNQKVSSGTAKIDPGVLSLDNAPANLPFNDSTPGNTNGCNIGSNGVVVDDLTANNGGWNLTAYWQTNWTKNSGAQQMTMASQMNWYPTTTGVITPGTGVAGGAIAGADGFFGGITSSNAKTMMYSNNATNYGAGSYNMTNLMFNYTVPIGSLTGSYNATLNLTLAGGGT
jgi:hypothetical protein